MKKSFERRFEKWEKRKRTVMGKKAFLQKYIKSLPQLDWVIKILCPFVVGTYAGLVIKYVRREYYEGMAVSILMTLLFGYFTYRFYFHRLKLHKRKIEEWKKELEELNKK